MKLFVALALLVASGSAAAPVSGQRLDDSAPTSHDLRLAGDRVSSSARIARLEAQQERVDDWFAQDKVRHFFVSYAAAAFLFGAATAAELDKDTGLAVSIGTAGLLGVGKEIRDRRTGRWFSVPDLVADALGLAAAYVTLRQTD